MMTDNEPMTADAWSTPVLTTVPPSMTIEVERLGTLVRLDFPNPTPDDLQAGLRLLVGLLPQRDADR